LHRAKHQRAGLWRAGEKQVAYCYAQANL